MSKIRVRFAPSPTGLLHVGGSRTALFNYYFAKSQGGEFLLRIEDTDTERSKKEFEADILASLKWLGLEPDEEPVYQSKRFDRYNECVDKLLSEGKAYRCVCSPEEIQAMREAAQKKGEKPRYNGKHRESGLGADCGKHVVRFKMPEEGSIVVDDAIAGAVSFEASELDDFIIRRSDGSPTYQLSVVVDDGDLKISHVIRGDDHLNNTPKQQVLCEALGFERPVFAHLPMILGPDKAKLSKRHGAVSTTIYKDLGYLPAAMRSYMIRLGWSHGDQELFTDEDLKRYFSFKGCGQSASVFDVKKLNWVNGQFMLKETPENLVKYVQENFSENLSSLLDNDDSLELLKGLVERSATIPELVELAKPFTGDDFPFDEKAVEKNLKDYPQDSMKFFAENLSGLSSWSKESIHELLQKTVDQSGLGFGKIAKPLRILVTGGLKSPDLSLVIKVIGAEKVQSRIVNYKNA